MSKEETIRVVIKGKQSTREAGMIGIYNWVKRLGQGHVSGSNGTTLCGKPMLGNNYAGHIKVRMPCETCTDLNKKEA